MEAGPARGIASCDTNFFFLPLKLENIKKIIYSIFDGRLPPIISVAPNCIFTADEWKSTTYAPWFFVCNFILITYVKFSSQPIFLFWFVSLMLRHSIFMCILTILLLCVCHIHRLSLALSLSPKHKKMKNQNRNAPFLRTLRTCVCVYCVCMRNHSLLV